MIQPSCVSLTESDLCHQPAFPNTFYHTMQSYVLQVFEIVTTTAAERRTSNRSNLAGSNIQKKRYPSDISSFSHFFESTRRRRTSGGRSPATTGAERRHSNRLNPEGLEHSRNLLSTWWSFHFSYLSTLHLHRKLFFHKKRGYPHWISSKSEHETGFEPATLALARRYSTTEPLVHR